MRLRDYFDVYEIEDIKGYWYVFVTVIICSGVAIFLLECGRDQL